MQVALISPISNLSFSNTSKVHLVLAHLLLKRQYSQFYQSLPEGNFKILDNGTAEGALVPDRALIDHAIAIGANEIVVPDVMMNCTETIERARHFARYAHPQFRYMGVLQGTTIQEWLKCWNAFDALDYIDVIAFPRNMSHEYKQQRFNLLSSLSDSQWFEEHRPVQVHCLGHVPSWPREVVALAELPVVRSIDTSAPAVYALNSLPIDERTSDTIERPSNFFDHLPMTALEEKLYAYNIDTYFGWAGYKPATSPSAV
jgi:hypothetical protein